MTDNGQVASHCLSNCVDLGTYYLYIICEKPLAVMLYLTNFMRHCKNEATKDRKEESNSVIGMERLSQSNDSMTKNKKGSSENCLHISSTERKAISLPNLSSVQTNFEDNKTPEDNNELSSRFLSLLCGLLNKSYFERFACYCHKNQLLIINDLADFSAYLACTSNVYLKARTYSQFHRQILLRGFEEVDLKQITEHSIVVYSHPDQTLLEKIGNEVSKKKNCCRKHIKLAI